MWIVVVFEKDHSVAAVPTNWFKDGYCAWPKKTLKNRGNMIELRVEPTKSEFDRFPARLLSSSPIGNKIKILNIFNKIFLIIRIE